MVADNRQHQTGVNVTVRHRQEKTPVRGETHDPGDQGTAMRIRIRALRSAVVCLLSALVCTQITSVSANAADPDPTAVIIFDGSGSMWGRIGAQTKFDIARTSMSAILPSYNRQIALGLIAYGHRRKSDCNDIEVLAAPELGLAGDIVDSIKAIRPRGKTPIASSLESAATLLADDRDGHIVLLTDGAENCRKDLCETVEAIREASPRLTISAIGLGLRERDVARVQCVAERGGGRMVVARTMSDLRTGLLNILDDIASGVSSVPSASSVKPVSPKAPAAPIGPPVLQLRALQAQTGPLIEGNVQWDVTRLDGDQPVTIYAKTSTSPNVEVVNGTYRVEARIGLANAARDITISEGGARSVHLPMNVARLDLQMAAPLLRGETIAIVQTSATGGVRIPPRLLTGRNATSERLFLPPGQYTIRRDGTVLDETRSVALEAGDNDALTFDTRMGTLSPRLKRSAVTSHPTPFLHIVQKQRAGNSNAWQEVTRSAAPNPTFALPAGAYRLVTRLGHATARQPVTITAGQTNKPEVTLPAGHLKLSTVDLSGGTLPSPVRYRVTPLQTQTRPTVTTNRTNTTLVLSPGAYKVEATAGHTNLNAATEVVLTDGKLERGELTFNPARLTLSIIKPEKTPVPRDVTWQVIQTQTNGSRNVVWSDSRRVAEIALAPGAYEIVARIEDRAATQRVTLVAGASRTIALPLP